MCVYIFKKKKNKYIDLRVVCVFFLTTAAVAAAAKIKKGGLPSPPLPKLKREGRRRQN
jgi:hypothetical protein